MIQTLASLRIFLALMVFGAHCYVLDAAFDAHFFKLLTLGLAACLGGYVQYSDTADWLRHFAASVFLLQPFIPSADYFFVSLSCLAYVLIIILKSLPIGGSNAYLLKNNPKSISWNHQQLPGAWK